MTSEEPPPMPAGPPPSAEPVEPAAPQPPDMAGDSVVDSVPGVTPTLPTVAAPPGLILPSDLPTWAPAEPPADPPANPPVELPTWAPVTPAAESAVSPPSEFAPPAGFSPPPPAGFSPPPPAGFAPPPPGSPPPAAALSGGAHSGGPAKGKGKGKLAALVAGLVVLVVLLAIGGYAIFHSSSTKAPAAAPAPTAPVTAPAPASPTAVETPSDLPTTEAPTGAPSVAPSPTVDANLGGLQAKMLQATIIAPLKNLTVDDLHVASATDNCVSLAANATAFNAHASARKALLAQLRKLDVTAMQDYQTWKGLLEQVQLKNIMFEQQLSAYAKGLEASCDPATATQNTHYKQAITLAKASNVLQMQFLASYNPVARRYNVPMQGAGKL